MLCMVVQSCPTLTTYPANKLHRIKSPAPKRASQPQQHLRRLLAPEEHALRVLDHFLDGVEEAHAFLSVDDPVVVAEGHVHDRADFNLAVDGDRTLDDVVHAEDGTLRRVDDDGG